ncbi:MAG: peptide ABC transporter substrate-binding protein [Oscillospiraceae bacterium]|nr:peptide ABC transporter substrate-binding protein [Oscillospiraceae bacterium]
MKKFVALLLVLAMMLSLAACGGSKKADGNVLPINLASEPDTLDPALNSAVDGATMIVHLFSGLAKWSVDENGAMGIVADCATELPTAVDNGDGTVTYTYTLREGMTWSDGQAVTAGDFEFAWKRAAAEATGSDYGYMFDVIKGYPNDLAVTAKDDLTLEVVLANNVAYWHELTAFPTYMPVREDVVSNEAWATDPSTYICNGVYTMTEWEHDSFITLTKNEKHHDAANVTMPAIKCYMSDDQNTMLTNFKKGDWLFIDDVPTNEMAALKTDYPTEFVIAGQIGTYYVCWNVNEEILPASSTLTGAEAEAAKAEIREALGLLLDRNYIVEEITQAGQVPASSFVPMGMKNADGSEFYETANSTEDDFNGYYNVATEAIEANFNEAVEVLKKYYTYENGVFTDFPTLTYLYNTSDAHKAIGEYMQTAFANVGITMQLENQEWNTFLNTRKEGDFSIARNGWIADYTDPICFLDMWISTSGNNDCQLGKGAHTDLAMYSIDLTPFGLDIVVENGTWAETYDVLIKEIKACTDVATRIDLMHYAEDMLMATGVIVPLYFYTDLYMLDDSVSGFFSIPLGYKYFMYTTINK